MTDVPDMVIDYLSIKVILIRKGNLQMLPVVQIQPKINFFQS